MAEPINTLQGERWQLSYDLDVDQIGDAHQAASALGYGLVDLSGWWNGDRECFAGIWTADVAAADDGTFDWYRGIALDKYQQINGLSAEGDGGIRPVRQHFYSTPDGVHLASIWRERATPWAVRHAMSAAELDEACAAALGRRLQLIDVSGYEDGGEVRYAAAWEQIGGADPTEVTVLHDVDHAALTKAFPDLACQGLLPIKITGFRVQHYWCSYMSVWVRPAHDAIEVRRRDDVEVERFGKVAAELVAAGYRPTQVAGYNTVAGARLGAIFENAEGRVAAFHGTDPDALQAGVMEANAADAQKRRNIEAERQKQLDAEARRRARQEDEQRRIAEKLQRRAEEAAQREREEEIAARQQAAQAAAAAEAAAAARAAAAPPTERVRVALDAALRPISDFLDGAVAALAVGSARNHGVDVADPAALAALITPRDVARIRDQVAEVVQSRGAAEMYICALRLEQAWHAKAGPFSLDLQGALTLMEISARAQYDAARLSVAAFFDSVTARVSGSAGIGVDGLGAAWAGGSLSGPGASGGAFLGLKEGAGAQIGVTYGRAEAAAGLALLGQRSQVGIGVSAGFELGLQLSATVSVRLGPLAAQVPNVPLAAVTWAAGALGDLITNPGRTVTGAVDDVAGAVGDFVGFLGDVAKGVVGVGESVVDAIGGLFGAGADEPDHIATKAETAADGRQVLHNETFEGRNANWIFVGGAGIDVDRGYAANGRNNAWVRGSNGIHALAGFFDVRRKAPYTLTLTMRTSPNANVVVGVRDAPGFNARGGVITEELRRVTWGQYRATSLKFTTTDTGRILVYVALVGTGGDTWCQIDNVRVHTETTIFD